MSLRVVLFTRSSRPSGAQMAWRLVQSEMPPVAVVVEKRGRMMEESGERGLPLFLKLGHGFIGKRVCEAFQIKLHYSLRKILRGRFKNPVYLSIEEWALDHPTIPIYRVEDHNGVETHALLQRLKPDIGILTNTRRIKKEILEIPRHGFLNLHLSALPQYAGLDSIFWALYHGEREIGVTVHFASDKIDQGDMVLQKKIPVSPFDDEASLYEKALWLGTHLMIMALKQLEDGTLERRPQDPTQASYFSWPTPSQRKDFRKRWKKNRFQIPAPTNGFPVLHLITRMTRGGAQENTLATALGLQRRGYSVTLLTGSSWGKEGEILSGALEEGLEVVILPSLVREINFWKDSLVLLKLLSWLAQRRYAIIHTHTSKAGFLGRVAAHFLNAPVVIHTPHGHVFHSYFHPWKEKLFLTLERQAARWSNRLIALTERERKEHLQLCVGSPEKWATIPSGVDEKCFQDETSERAEILRSLGISPERRIIGFIGRLAPVKGAAYLVEALPRIQKAIPEIHCLVVGDGEQRIPLQKRVCELGLEESVAFLGHREKVSRFLSTFDVLVVPSLNEGMGRVIVEGGLLRKPVVGTRVGGIPDLIDEDETGLLVEPRNPDQIAKAVIQLLRDPELSQRLGAGLQDKVLNGFTANQMVEKIDRLYQELLVEKGMREFNKEEIKLEDRSLR